MAKQSGETPGLSEAEWAVMNVFWQHGPMAAGEANEHLSADQDWAYATVRTLMRRLVAKGWLTYREVGSSFLYRAKIPQKRAIQSAVREFSDRVLNGLSAPFIAYYAEEKGLTPKDVAALRRILDEHQEGGE